MLFENIIFGHVTIRSFGANRNLEIFHTRSDIKFDDDGALIAIPYIRLCS